MIRPVQNAAVSNTQADNAVQQVQGPSSAPGAEQSALTQSIDQAERQAKPSSAPQTAPKGQAVSPLAARLLALRSDAPLPQQTLLDDLAAKAQATGDFSVTWVRDNLAAGVPFKSVADAVGRVAALESDLRGKVSDQSMSLIGASLASPAPSSQEMAKFADMMHQQAAVADMLSAVRGALESYRKDLVAAAFS